MTIPNLAGVATDNLVEKIGGGNFSASYINWSRTLQMLRDNAPGWLPEVVPNADGGLLHHAPVGAYLLIRFRNGENVTPAVPQAVMDSRNAAIPRDKITARDVTDTHRRGICMAAAMTFGLAYELWAKIPLESGYSKEEDGADNEYAAFEDEHLPILQDAAMDGMKPLEAAFKALPAGEHKTSLWAKHSASLKAAAKKVAA